MNVKLDIGTRNKLGNSASHPPGVRLLRFKKSGIDGTVFDFDHIGASLHESWPEFKNVSVW